jgi:FkbM family methyltransferase
MTLAALARKTSAMLRRRAGFVLIDRLRVQRGDLGLERLGSEYGGWWVPVSLLGRESVVYSVGVGEDVTFDEELHRRCGCTIHAFDPTPRAQRYVERVRPVGITFHPYGVWRSNGTTRFYAPQDPSHVSHSILNLQDTETFFEGEVRTLGTAMKELGHPRIDLLKMDIEGAEYAVLEDMLATGVRPRIVCVELEHPSPVRNVRAVLAMRRVGYDVCRVDGRNVTLVLHQL